MWEHEEHMQRPAQHVSELNAEILTKTKYSYQNTT